MEWVKDKLGLNKKKIDAAALASADNGRFLVDIEAKEYVSNVNIRDVNEMVEINLDEDTDAEDEDDDDSAPLIDGDFVLVKFRRGLRFLATVKEHEDVPKNTVRINKLGRENIKCGPNDLVSVSPYPPDAKEGQPKETLENAVKVTFQVSNIIYPPPPPKKKAAAIILLLLILKERLLKDIILPSFLSSGN